MITISLAEAKNRFSELVSRVQNGEQVSVTRREQACGEHGRGRQCL